MIDLVDDFRDLLIELSDADAEFVVVGGYAVAFHGHPRATKDLDILVRPTDLMRSVSIRLSPRTEHRLILLRLRPTISRITAEYSRSVCRRAELIC